MMPGSGEARGDEAVANVAEKGLIDVLREAVPRAPLIFEGGL
jgi:hypothetical protein